MRLLPCQFKICWHFSGDNWRNCDFIRVNKSLPNIIVTSDFPLINWAERVVTSQSHHPGQWRQREWWSPPAMDYNINIRPHHPHPHPHPHPRPQQEWGRHLLTDILSLSVPSCGLRLLFLWTFQAELVPSHGVLPQSGQGRLPGSHRDWGGEQGAPAVAEAPRWPEHWSLGGRVRQRTPGSLVLVPYWPSHQVLRLGAGPAQWRRPTLSLRGGWVAGIPVGGLPLWLPGNLHHLHHTITPSTSNFRWLSSVSTTSGRKQSGIFRL